MDECGRYPVAVFKAAKAAFKRISGRKAPATFDGKVFCYVKEHTVDFYFTNAYELFLVTYRKAGNELTQFYEVNVARMLGLVGSCKSFNVGGDWQAGGLSALNAGIVKVTNSDTINQLYRLVKDMCNSSADDSVAMSANAQGFMRVMDVAGKLGVHTLEVERVRNAFMFEGHIDGVDFLAIEMAVRR